MDRCRADGSRRDRRGATYVDANDEAARPFAVHRDDIVGRPAGSFTRPDAGIEDAGALGRLSLRAPQTAADELSDPPRSRNGANEADRRDSAALGD